MSETPLKYILEAALLASGRPLSIDQCLSLFLDSEQPDRDAVRAAMDELAEEYSDRSIELKQVASGYRIQVREAYSEWVTRLWSERPSRYSRALLETMALMAYRQPITRGEIEEIRGVSVSSNIIKTLLERDWIKVVGYRDVPGKPAMYGTTRVFLDYFNLKSLDDLPTLAELRDIDSINVELDLEIPGVSEAKKSSEEVADGDTELSAEGNTEDNVEDMIDSHSEDNTEELVDVSVEDNAEDMADVSAEDNTDERAEVSSDVDESIEDTSTADTTDEITDDVDDDITNNKTAVKV
jgi:segregation and condensation protein B